MEENKKNVVLGAKVVKVDVREKDIEVVEGDEQKVEGAIHLTEKELQKINDSKSEHDEKRAVLDAKAKEKQGKEKQVEEKDSQELGEDDLII